MARIDNGFRTWSILARALHCIPKYKNQEPRRLPQTLRLANIPLRPSSGDRIERHRTTVIDYSVRPDSISAALMRASARLDLALSRTR